MHYIKLKALNREVSRLGLGTVKLGRNQQVKYPNAFNIPNDEEALSLLNLATELGINLIDTAPAYGNSEKRLGELLPKINNDWVIASKAGENFINGESFFDFRANAIVASVERSLSLLKRETIDILLIHSNGDDKNIINKYDIFSTLNGLKKQGKILSGGMSVKTDIGAKLTLEYSDILMYEINNIKSTEATIKKAQEEGKQILLKKALASGHKIMSNNPMQNIINSFKDGLSYEQVASIMVGTINRKHLEMNSNAIDIALG